MVIYLITDSTILCVENIDKFDTEWGITAEKTLVTLPCNGNYTGSVSRYCNYGGKWMEPDYSQCMRKTIQNIHAQVNNNFRINQLFVLLSEQCPIFSEVFMTCNNSGH